MYEVFFVCVWECHSSANTSWTGPAEDSCGMAGGGDSTQTHKWEGNTFIKVAETWAKMPIQSQQRIKGRLKSPCSKVIWKINIRTWDQVVNLLYVEPLWSSQMPVPLTKPMFCYTASAHAFSTTSLTCVWKPLNSTQPVICCVDDDYYLRSVFLLHLPALVGIWLVFSAAQCHIPVSLLVKYWQLHCSLHRSIDLTSLWFLHSHRLVSTVVNPAPVSEQVWLSHIRASG